MREDIKKFIALLIVSSLTGLTVSFVGPQIGYEPGVISYIVAGLLVFALVTLCFKYKVITRIKRNFVEPEEFSIYSIWDISLKPNDREKRNRIVQQYFSLFKEIGRRISPGTPHIRYYLYRQNKRWMVKDACDVTIQTAEDFASIDMDDSYLPYNIHWGIVFPDPKEITKKDMKSLVKFFRENPNIFYRNKRLCFEDVFSKKYYYVKENLFDENTWNRVVKYDNQKQS